MDQPACSSPFGALMKSPRSGSDSATPMSAENSESSASALTTDRAALYAVRVM